MHLGEKLASWGKTWKLAQTQGGQSGGCGTNQGGRRETGLLPRGSQRERTQRVEHEPRARLTSDSDASSALRGKVSCSVKGRCGRVRATSCPVTARDPGVTLKLIPEHKDDVIDQPDLLVIVSNCEPRKQRIQILPKVK